VPLPAPTLKAFLSRSITAEIIPLLCIRNQRRMESKAI
jgi:hypothetical protein